MENMCIFIGAKDLGKMLAVSIGNENLAEIITLHEFYDAFHPLAIESIEYII
jgi:hypothetical protein